MQKAKRSGLPETITMKHDGHFVEWISTRSAAPLVRMIAIDRIDPNPHQARSELGNIQELMESIKSKGVLEPIIVRARGDRYEIIAGERRYQASRNIGLQEMPCIEMNVSDSEAMEISLIENLQRKDLDPFEEADGLNTLIDIYGYSHSQISEKIGKARSTITEVINISRIPDIVRHRCHEKGIINRSILIEISKMKTEADMLKLVNEVGKKALKREDTRELSKQLKGKPPKEKRYVFQYAPPAKDENYFRLKIEFQKERISRHELIKILEEIIEKLRFSQI